MDLVIDHSVQVDVARSENAVQANMEFEFQRNNERFAFLKWGSSAFHNMLVVPPGSGIVHQVCDLYRRYFTCYFDINYGVPYLTVFLLLDTDSIHFLISFHSAFPIIGRICCI